VDYWRNRQPIYPLINDVFTNSTPFSSEPAATWPTACEELAFWASPLAEIVRLASHNCAGEAKVGHFWRLPKQQNAFVRHTIFSGAFPTYRLLDQNPARLHKKSRRCSCLRVTGGFFPDPRAIAISPQYFRPCSGYSVDRQNVASALARSDPGLLEKSDPAGSKLNRSF